MYMRGEYLGNLKHKVRYERVAVDKERLARKCPIRSKKHMRSETGRNSEVDSKEVETIHSRDLHVNRGALAATSIKETGEIEAADDRSRYL